MEIVKRRRGEGLRETNTHKSTVIDKDPRQMNEGTRFYDSKSPWRHATAKRYFGRCDLEFFKIEVTLKFMLI